MSFIIFFPVFHLIKICREEKWLSNFIAFNVGCNFHLLPRCYICISILPLRVTHVAVEYHIHKLFKHCNENVFKYHKKFLWKKHFGAKNTFRYCRIRQSNKLQLHIALDFQQLYFMMKKKSRIYYVPWQYHGVWYAQCNQILMYERV